MARHEAIVLSVYPVNEPGTVSIVTAATELRILIFPGRLAACALYNAVLSAARVTDHYSAGA